MKINQYIQQYRNTTSLQTPHVRCRDGFTMSVQAGRDSIYSIPRGVADHYENVEVGFPSDHVPEFKEYDQDSSVFPFVPCSVVDKVIDNHGGIVLSRRLYS